MTRRFFALTAVCLLGYSAAMSAQAPPAAWRQAVMLKASNPGMFDHFGEGGALDGHTGNSVAVSADGSTMAVGAQHESSAARGVNGNQNDESAYNAGAVYVFTRSGNGWTQQAYIKASNTGSGDHFGNVVALSDDGNTLAVGAYWESSSATGINGNQNDNSIPQAGAAYVFTRSGATWTQQAYIKASNTGKPGKGEEPGEGDQFGFSVALSGDGNTLAVGAASEDSNAGGINGNQADDSASSAGAVYVYGRTGSLWAQQAYVKSDTPTNATLGDQFGYSVSLNGDGNVLAIGVYDEAGSGRGVNMPVDTARNGSGAAYVFRRTGTTWAKDAYLKAWNAEQGDSWGVAVAISADGNTMALGSLDEDCACSGVHTDQQVGNNDRMANTSSGAVAVFARTGGTWAQQAFIKASNVDDNDWFGVRLALSGDGSTLVVGAQNEDSPAKTGAQNDNSAIEAGAVYVFSRTATAWTQSAFLKGSNTEAYDEFGGSVVISRDGRTLLVGARGEDSNGAGAPADNSVDESGAAYVFTR